MLDEVQMVDEFTDVLNSLLHISNADVYVTGSNSHFLSTDVVTEFRGRGDEIHLFPLSFSEYCEGYKGTTDIAWKDYYTYGGLPLILTLDTDKKKEDYLNNLYKSVYLVDVLERHKVKTWESLMNCCELSPLPLVLHAIQRSLPIHSRVSRMWPFIIRR